MKAVLCPVCGGRGRTYFYDSTGTQGEECHACKECGYLLIPERSFVFPAPNTQTNDGRCPTCGGDRGSPMGTACPIGSHYGVYC